MDFSPIIRAFRPLAWQNTTYRQKQKLCLLYVGKIAQKKFLKYFFKKPGEGGGIFIMDSYKPYCNTLTLSEQEKLMEMYAKAEGGEKEILKRILRKYGADKLEL